MAIDKLTISSVNDPLINPNGYTKFEDYHANNTIQLCELLNAGFPLLNDENQNNDDKTRINTLATRHYYYREIGGSPWEFKNNYNRILFEEYSKLEPLYDLLNEGKLNIRQGDQQEFKSRTIHSDYPQSQIQTDGQDYASGADDHEDKTDRQLSVLDAYERYADLLNKYDNLDNRIVKELGNAFSMLLTPFINYW